MPLLTVAEFKAQTNSVPWVTRRFSEVIHLLISNEKEVLITTHPPTHTQTPSHTYTRTHTLSAGTDKWLNKNILTLNTLLGTGRNSFWLIKMFQRWLNSYRSLQLKQTVESYRWNTLPKYCLSTNHFQTTGNPLTTKALPFWQPGTRLFYLKDGSNK